MSKVFIIAAVLLVGSFAPMTWAKKILIDGQRYETCAGKYHKYPRQLKDFKGKYRSALRGGMWKQYHDNDDFSGVREYETPACTFAGGFSKTMSAMAYSPYDATSKKMMAQSFEEGFKLRAVAKAADGKFTYFLTFTNVQWFGENAVQGSEVKVKTRAGIRSIPALPRNKEVHREVAFVTGGAYSQGAYLGLTKQMDATWSKGGGSFVIPADLLAEFSETGIKFRIYGENAPKQNLYMPPEFLRAFVDSIRDFESKHYGAK